MNIPFKSVFVAALFAIGITVASQAQNSKPLKLGYTSVDYILVQLPQSKQIESELKAYEAQLTKQLQDKNKELQDKYAAYQKGEALMAEPVKADKQKELQDLQARIQEFQQNAESSMQKKQQQLLQPVYELIQKNIKLVADENGYTYIFNSDVLLHGPESDNLSDLVLKKLGVTPAAKTTTPATSTAPLAPKATAPATK
jgi:outer membrane protein